MRLRLRGLRLRLRGRGPMSLAVKRLLAAAALVLLFSSAAWAADYKFSVDENFSDITIREDGGIDIKYRLTFTCAKNGKPIDIVDVGFPNNYFELGSVRAWINDNPVSGIKNSSFIPVGVEVPLTSHEINPGSTGTLTIEGSNPHMVFPDTEDANFASMEFYPTYYGSQFTTGSTRLKVAIHFPAGADSQKVKWHYSQFNKMEQDRDGRLVYIWEINNASSSQQYRFGVSFPKTLVKNIFAPIEPANFEAKTSWSNWFSANCSGPGFVFGLIGIFIFAGYIAERRRRMRYFPPAAKVEGLEIRRGLTAPEAALLIEVPLNKVAAMIMFGLKQKGAVDISTSPKLNISVLNKNVQGLRPYETAFLALVDAQGGLPEKTLAPFFIKMIKDVKDKMVGFNMEQSRRHYRSIITQAWDQVKNSGTEAEAARLLEQSLTWLMIDKDMDDKLKDSLGQRQVPPPVWLYTGSFSHGSGGSASPMSGVQFADQVVSRIESVSSSTVAKLEGFTTGITNTTNPPPKGAGGGHGGGGGCACACAGCACACAGGGR
jgi:hypothetical protein